MKVLANSFRDYDSKVGRIMQCVDFGSMEDLDEWLKLPIFDLNKDTEFSPDLSETEINSLKDPDLFTKKELLAMVNTLLIEKLSKEKEEYERLVDMAMIMPQYPIPNYKDGGIHIKKKNRGKFNALKKRTGKTTEELTHSKNPLTRKRAIFAQNAKKWKHKGRKKK